MTGADYLIVLAQSAADREQPYAYQFASMLRAAFDDEGRPMTREIIARRPLKEHEASPVAIVATAVKAALDSGDRTSVEEALNVGLAMLAKWPDYLDGYIDGHPDLVRRPSE